MLVINYITWHYSAAISGILQLFRNYSLFVWRKFYILEHLKTFFAPWHQLSAKYMFPAKGFADKIGNLITDIFIRILAAAIRLTIIVLGLLAQVVVILAFAILATAWVLWPAVVIVYTSKGLGLIL